LAVFQLLVALENFNITFFYVFNFAIICVIGNMSV